MDPVFFLLTLAGAFGFFYWAKRDEAPLCAKCLLALRLTCWGAIGLTLEVLALILVADPKSGGGWFVLVGASLLAIAVGFISWYLNKCGVHS